MVAFATPISRAAPRCPRNSEFSSRQPVLAKSVGRIVFALVFSDNGTPSDYSDDFPLSMSVVSIAGPHPFATGALNRCDLIAAALS